MKNSERRRILVANKLLKTKLKSINNINLFIKLGILTVITFIIQLVLNKNFPDNYNEILSYLGNGAKVSALICAIQEIRIAQKSYNANNEYLRVENSINLAKYYQQELLEVAAVFSELYSNHASKYSNFIKSIPEEKMIDFDINELEEIFKENKFNYEFEDFSDFLDGFSNIIKDSDFQLNFCSISYSTCPDKESEALLLGVMNKQEQISKLMDEQNSLFEEIEKLKKEDDKEDLENLLQIEKEYKELGSRLEEIVPLSEFSILSKINSDKNCLLNKLEHFSMSFNLNIANEEAIYPSLHQTFRAVIKNLYIDIAIRNKNEVEKYYTNIISLYHLWNTRCENEKQKEKDRMKAIKNKSVYKSKAWSSD